MEQWLGPAEQSASSLTKREAGFAFLAGGSSSVIEWWLRSGMKESPEEIAAFISGFSKSVADGLSG